MVSLGSSGWPGTHCVDQGGLEVIQNPASASKVLVLEECNTTPEEFIFLNDFNFVHDAMVVQYVS